jgi:hypothetical protein
MFEKSEVLREILAPAKNADVTEFSEKSQCEKAFR